MLNPAACPTTFGMQKSFLVDNGNKSLSLFIIARRKQKSAGRINRPAPNLKI
jgi:hypothetical protein